MKETFYFSHDYNTRTNAKIKKLIMKFGYEGYGIFWALVEDLYNNANALRLDYDCIAFDLRTKSETVKSIVEDFDLFQIAEGFITSEGVQERLERRNEKSQKAKESAFARWNKPKDANALQTQSEGNAIKESKVNKNKEKEIKDNILTFESFWQMYGKKKDRKICEDKFKKLTVSELESIKAHLPNYVKSTPEIKYRKDPATYLNQKSYLDALESKVNLFNENIFEGLRFFYKNVPSEIFIDRDKCIAIPDSVYGYCTRVIKYPEYTKLRNFLEKNGIDINNLPPMNEDPQNNFTDVEPLERLKQWIGKN